MNPELRKLLKRFNIKISKRNHYVEVIGKEPTDNYTTDEITAAFVWAYNKLWE